MLYVIIFGLIVFIGSLITFYGTTYHAYKRDLEWVVAIGVSIMLFISWSVPLLIYDTKEKPLIDEKAHHYCESQGYDTFEEWTGVGVFPSEYNFVKCKYADNSFKPREDRSSE